METINVDFPVNKDFKEVVDLIDGLVEKIQAKAPITEYTELIAKLTAAAEGFGNVMAVVKTNNRDECMGYMIQVLMQRLMPVKVVEPKVDAVTDATT